MKYDTELHRSYFWSERRLPTVAADRRAQEEVVRSSGLDWILVKPPRLTDGPRIGLIQVGADVRLGIISKISRSDLADIIVGEIEQSRFIGEAIFASER
jgi:putative NADH-flavin reductase